MAKTSSTLVRIASSLFFLSGFAALIYEVIWFKRFAHVWGNATLAQTSVVAAFLFGLALGAFYLGRLADRVKSPLGWYCVCEMLVGLFALAIPYEIVGLRWISSQIYSTLQAYPVVHFAVRFILTFLAIGPPCFLMGGTLPLLMKHFLIVQPWNRETTGWLYAVNTLGGAFGAFFAGFYLLPGLGMIGGNGLAVAIDFYVALLVFLLLRQYPQAAPPTANPATGCDTPFPAVDPCAAAYFSPKAIYLASALTGCASLILQMIWTRQLALILGGTTYAFSSMLFVFLLGIGIGSLIYSRVARQIRRLALTLILLTLLLITFIAFGKLSVPYLCQAVGFMRGLRANSFLNGVISIGANAVIQLVPTICMGFLFPLFVDILRWRARDVGAVVGNIYTWNTAGSILGAALTPVALLAVWGSGISVAVCIVLYGLSLAIVYPYSQKKAIWLLPPTLAFSFLIAMAVSRPEDPRRTSMGLYLYGYISTYELESNYQVLYFKESVASNVLALETQTNRHLRINGKVDASDTSDMPMQMGLAYYPRLFHPQAREVLVIGYGSGTTAGASLMFPYTRVACCEIDPAVVEAGVNFSHVNHEPERSRNFSFILDDGRSYLEGCQKNFDLILSEPSNPWIAGISNLFTRDFYLEVKNRLNPKGIFTQWIHTYSFTSAEYRLIVRTLLDVFPHAALLRISSSDTLFLASDRPLLPTIDDIRAAQKLLDDSPAVLKDLEIIFNTADASALLLRSFMIPEEHIRQIAETDAERGLNTDLNMRLEFTAPLQLFVLKDWQENVDKTLLGETDPAWWIERFQAWGCSARQIPSLKIWIENLLNYDFLDKAEPLVKFALQQTPDDPALLANNLLFTIKSPEEFNHTLDRLIALSVDRAFQAGLDLRGRNYTAQAVQIFERIVRQRPNWTTAWTHLALWSMDLQRWKEAEDRFARALEIDPQNPFLIESYDIYQKNRPLEGEENQLLNTEEK